MILHTNSYSIPYKVSTGEPCVLEITETVSTDGFPFCTIIITAAFHSIQSTICHDFICIPEHVESVDGGISVKEYADMVTRCVHDQVQPIMSQNHLRAKAIKGLLDEMKVMYDALRLIFEGESS